MTTVPYPYQRVGIKKISRFGGRALLADEMGLGKTYQALQWMHQGGIRPTVVVCPAGIKWNWEEEAKLHLNLRAEVLEGRRPRRWERMLTPHPLTVVNYDILGDWLPYLHRLSPDLVILDEVQYIKNLSAKRTEYVFSLCAGTPFVLGLSGTPLTNRPAELFPILHLLRPDVWPAFWPFARRHCGPRRRPWGMEFKGATRLEELNTTLRREVMIRRLKRDVAHQLPAKTRTVVPLDLSNRKEYNEAVLDFIKWLAKYNQSKARKAQKAERLVRFGYLKRLAARLKMPSVMEWLDSYLAETDEKLLLFGIHKAAIRMLRERYDSISVVVDGTVTGRHRKYAVDKFHQDKRTRLMLGNIQAAGVGWNCRATSTVGFVEMGWTPGEHTQAENRAHGIGRGVEGVPFSAYYLVARDSIEEMLCRLVQNKQKVLDDTLDGGPTNGSGLDIFDQLTIELKRAVPGNTQRPRRALCS